MTRLLELVATLVVGVTVGKVVERWRKPSTREVGVQADGIVDLQLEDLTLNAVRARLKRYRRSTGGTRDELVARLRVDEPWWG